MFDIDYQAVRFWIDMAIMLWMFMVSGFVIWDRRNKVTQDAIQTLRHEVAKELADLKLHLDTRRLHVDEALSTMRTRQSDTPTRGDIAQLYAAINGVSAISVELRGTVHALQNTMQMLNQHLLDK